jgi:predicted component of type VI protein secretion system
MLRSTRSLITAVLLCVLLSACASNESKYKPTPTAKPAMEMTMLIFPDASQAVDQNITLQLQVYDVVPGAKHHEHR